MIGFQIFSDHHHSLRSLNIFVRKQIRHQITWYYHCYICYNSSLHHCMCILLDCSLNSYFIWMLVLGLSHEKIRLYVVKILVV